MFLKPLDRVPGGDLAAGISGKAGSAWAAFVDDQPVFGSDGGARIEIRRRRRLPFLKDRVEALPAGRATTPLRPLRTGDVVSVDVDGEGAGTRWRYDRDGNLGRPMRAFMAAVRAGTFASCLAISAWVCVEWAQKSDINYYGGPGTTNPVGIEIAANYRDLYPPKKRMSDFYKASIESRKQKEDPKEFFRRWKDQNPVLKEVAEDRR